MDYQIKSGDTLWKIAKEQCGASSNAEISAKIDELCKLNNIKNPNSIFAGTSLKLKEDTYVPQDKEEDKGAEAAFGNKVVEHGPDMAERFNDWVDAHTANYDRWLGTSIDDMGSPEEFQKTKEEIGAFSFIDENIELKRADGTTNKEIYVQEGAKFAKAMLDSWEQDNEEGISYAEYYDAEVERANGMEITPEYEGLIKDAFDMMDLDGNKVITTEEAQSIYSVVDMADSPDGPDGKISIDYWGNPEIGDVIKDNAIMFRDQFLE